MIIQPNLDLLRREVKKHHQVSACKQMTQMELDIFVLRHDFALSFESIAKLKNAKLEFVQVMYEAVSRNLCDGEHFDVDKLWRRVGIKKSMEKMGRFTPEGVPVYISAHARSRFTQRKERINMTIENYVKSILVGGRKIKKGFEEYKYTVVNNSVILCKEEDNMVVKTIY